MGIRLQIYNIRSGRFSYKLDVGRKGMRKWACTSMSFRPSKFSKVTENVLVSCGMDASFIEATYYHYQCSSISLNRSKLSLYSKLSKLSYVESN